MPINSKSTIADTMTDTAMGRTYTRDTSGRIAVVALCGLLVGIVIAFAVEGVRETVRELTVEPVACISQTWA